MRPRLQIAASTLAVSITLLAAATARSQTTNWTGAAGVNGSGNYNVLGNWDNGIPNGAGFNAVVSTTNGGTSYTITLNSAATVTSLAISSPQATFDHTSATYMAAMLNISAGVYRLGGGTLQGATVNVSGTGVLRATSTLSTLSGVSVVGGLDMATPSARILVQANGGMPTMFAAGTALTLGTSAFFEVNQTGVLDGIAFTLANGSGISAEGNNTVTFGPATTITLPTSGSASLAQPQQVAGTSSFVNQGLIQSTATNGTLTISPNGTFTNGTASPNSGIVRASGGGIVTFQTSAFTNQAGGLVDVQSGSTANINGPGWSNLGTFQVTSGTLNLGGTFTTSAIGTITRSGTSVVRLTGSVNNAGASNLLALTGPLQLSGGTITGGNLVASGASVLQPTSSNGTLSGVAVGLGALDLTASGTGLLIQANGGTPTTFAAGTALTFGTSAFLRINQTGVLDNVAFTLANGSIISAEANNTVTFGPATTVTLATPSGSATLAQPQQIGGTSSFANQGLIQSTATNGTLTISPNGTFTNGTASPNSGIVRASGGGIVTFQTSAFTNQAGGLVDVQSGSTANINGPGWSNLGTFQVTSGTLNLGGTFTTSAIGTITRSGTSVVRLTSSVNNTGASNLLALTGPLQLAGGTITGGNLVASGASVLQPTSSNGTLSGVAVGLGALDLTASGTGLLIQANGGTPTTFAAGTALTFGTSAFLRINQTGVLDNVAFTLANGSIISAEANNTVTFGPATTITLATPSGSATLAQPQQLSGASSFVNQGLIQSTAANTTLTIQPNATFTNGTASPNSGIVRASGGGIVTFQTSAFTNQAGGLVDVQSGSTGNINGPGWSNIGTFQVTSGTLNLGGTFTTSAIGTITRSGTSVVRLTGSVNNAGASNLLALTGPLQLAGGTITGGNLVASGASVLQPTSSSGTLSGVAVGLGAVDLAASSVLLVQANGGTPTTFAAGTALTLGTGAGLRINQTAVLDNITFTLGNGSVISAEANNTVTFGPATTITLATPSGSATLAQPQVISGTSSLVNQGLIQSTAANATLSITPNGMFTNSGTLTAINGGIVTIPITTNLTNFSAGTLTGGTYRVFASSVINFNGRVITTVGPGTTVLLDGASSVFTAANTIATNNGSFTISNGRQHTVGTFTNGGELVVGTAAGDLARLTSNVQVSTGGVVKGTGTIAGPVNLASGSTLAPGTSPGVLTISGAVTMTTGAVFGAQLNGSTAGSGYSQLSLNGGGSIDLNNATLSTTLGYAPLSTDSFAIITGGTVTGIFNNQPNNSMVTLGTFMGQTYMATIVYNANSVILTLPVPEPASILLICAGVGAGIGAVRRGMRNRRSKSAESGS